jgi:hypothetical protein
MERASSFSGLEMTDDQKKFELSVLEAEILVTIDNIGWYAYLWFPIVYRELMNFGSDASDEQVHSAFASLIRKCALVVHQEKCGEIPEWKLAPGVLEIAKDVMSLGTDLRTRYGYSDPGC